MSEDNYLEDIQWPAWIAVPKPGQSIDADDCLHVSTFKATVQQMTTFLLHEPPHVDKTTLEKLSQLVNYARAKAKPGDNFLEALGMDPAAIEQMQKSFSEHLLSGSA